MGHTLLFADCMGPEGMATLPDQSVDHVISDPPYSEHCHAGITTTRNDGGKLTELNYNHLTTDQVELSAKEMVRVCKGWILVMSDHALWPAWKAALGRYSFQPIPIVIRGMTVRLTGDGPSSWCVWMMANRPIGFPPDGTKDGAYVGDPGARGENPVKGAKPRWLMDRLIVDYTKRGQTVLDPFMGGGTTGESCIRYGRNFIGMDNKQEHFDLAKRRIEKAREQLTMFDLAG